VLVANAGLPASGKLDSFTAEQVGRALRVNLEVPIQMTRQLIPAFAARGSGHFVYLSSIYGRMASARSGTPARVGSLTIDVQMLCATNQLALIRRYRCVLMSGLTAALTWAPAELMWMLGAARVAHESGGHDRFSGVVHTTNNTEVSGIRCVPLGLRGPGP